MTKGFFTSFNLFVFLTTQPIVVVQGGSKVGIQYIVYIYIYIHTYITVYLLLVHPVFSQPASGL